LRRLFAPERGSALRGCAGSRPSTRSIALSTQSI
jgi:hypothetical protein